MKILSDESNFMAASWLPHGFSFRIHDRPAFLALLTDYEQRFMPGKGGDSPGAKSAKKRATIKWTSLTRKLCRWNILRMSAGPDAGAFFHPKMQRDCPELVHDMVIGGDGNTVAEVQYARQQQQKQQTKAATQFAQAKAAALQQQAQAQALATIQAQTLTQAQQPLSLLPMIHPPTSSLPLVPAAHLTALNSLQELVQQSKLAAIRAGPVLGFDAKVIEAELLSQHAQQPRSQDGGEGVASSVLGATPARSAQPQRQTITQTILAGAASATANRTPATTPNNSRALSLQQAQVEEERQRLLVALQFQLGQERQRQAAVGAAVVGGATGITADAAAKGVDATVPTTDMSGEVVLNPFSTAQA